MSTREIPVYLFTGFLDAGKGNLGVIVSKKGVGKTACLVHIATDKLFKGEHVIHVSFSGNVEHVINWYKEVYREIVDNNSLDDANEVYEQILSNRCLTFTAIDSQQAIYP